MRSALAVEGPAAATVWASDGRLARRAPAVLVFVVVLALGMSGGGYFPPAWGWASLAFTVALLGTLVLRPELRLSGIELATVGALATFAGWVWLSAVWSDAPGQAVLEGERALLYVLGIAAILALARPPSAVPLLGGLAAAIAAVSAWGLATRLFPERIGVFDPVTDSRLAEPLGYWNGLAAFAALGTLLALGIAASARAPAARALAAASLVPTVATIYFTFSRAGWGVLAVGLVAAALLGRSARLPAWAAVLAPAPALAVAVAWQSPALTRRDAALADASAQGHRLAVIVVVLSVVSALVALGVARLERGIRFPRAARRTFAAGIALAAAAALAAGLWQVGGPAGAWRSFAAKPAPPPTDLSERLQTFSGAFRVDMWRVAVREYERHPLVGSGAGSFERAWLRDRPTDYRTRDAHSLYVETLAEFGPIGLTLLVGALGLPLAAAMRARSRPLVPVAGGAYAAFLVHAGLDWDWELPAITLAAMFVGAAILVAARRAEPRPLRLRSRNWLLGIVLVVGAASFVGLVGNLAVAASAAAAREADWDRSIAHARRAATWAPWSPEPWTRLGEAHMAQGDIGRARAAFHRAVEKSPADWSRWLDLARAASGTERADALREAARLNPLSPELAQFRAELAGETASAVEREGE